MGINGQAEREAIRQAEGADRGLWSVVIWLGSDKAMAEQVLDEIESRTGYEGDLVEDYDQLAGEVWFKLPSERPPRAADTANRISECAAAQPRIAA